LLIASVAFDQQRADPKGSTANESTGQVFVVRALHSMLMS
jgi:hypothetical protein